MSCKQAGVIVAMMAVSTTVTADTTKPVIPGHERMQCPDAVRGVDMARETVRGGVAFKFTTSNRLQLPSLRALLREAATMIEHHSKLAALHPEQMPVHGGVPSFPVVDIDVKDIATGARITVHAENTDELPALRELGTAFEEFWDKNACVRGERIEHSATRT